MWALAIEANRAISPAPRESVLTGGVALEGEALHCSSHLYSMSKSVPDAHTKPFLTDHRPHGRILSAGAGAWHHALLACYMATVPFQHPSQHLGSLRELAGLLWSSVLSEAFSAALCFPVPLLGMHLHAVSWH